MKRLAWPTPMMAVAIPAAGEPPADRPGQEFQVRPADMPKPFIAPSASNGSQIVARRPGQLAIAPPGFKVIIFA